MANGDKTLNTGGGASVGNVQTGGGDFVGRDQINFIVPLGNWEEIKHLLFKDEARTNLSKALQAQFHNFDWAKAEQAYLDKVIKLYDRVRILGSSADVPLGNLFTQVYILDKPTARYRHDIDELSKRGTERNEFQRQPGARINGLTLVKQGQNLFILGKPGAGKTTFLKYITIQAAHKQLPLIPIFVSLNQWADSRWGKGDKAALLPFLVEQFDICDFPDAALFIDYLLKEGRALVLFDGLDEVKEEKDQRRRLTRLLQDFANKYDQSQYLITCRIAASDYAFERFADVEVADFTPVQVREYARNWFGEQEKKFDAFTTELAKPENKGLAELCNTPLLLSLLCLTFDNNICFPHNRAELYEDALEILLRKWDSSRQIQRDDIYRTLSYKRKLQLLMNIAIPTFEKGELFFRQRDLEQWIVDYLAILPGTPPKDTLDGTVILKAIEAQHSIFSERAQGIYSFSHLTFQEYLTARYLSENLGKEVTRELLHSHLTDPRWREVFLLTASLLANSDNFMSILRQVIDGIIAGTPSLLQLLRWVHEHTQQANVPDERRILTHLSYIFLTLAIAMKIDLNVLIVESLNLARALSLEQDREIDLAFSRARSLALTRNADRTYNSHHLQRVFDIAGTRIRTLAFARTATSLVGFDYGLYYAWSYAILFAGEKLEQTDRKWQDIMRAMPSLVVDVASLADEGGRDDLAQLLVAEPVPSYRASKQEWLQYAVTLFAILRNERDLGYEWTLSKEDIKTLRSYLYANELFVQCLHIAAVSNRQNILQKLLLPPTARQDKKIERQEENKGNQP